MMNKHDGVELLEMEESLSIRVEEPTSTKKTGRCFWIRRITNINDGSNEKHHQPVFIIFMCILHIFIHLFKYVKITWNGQDFEQSLTNLFMIFLPCMRTTPDHIRIGVASCNPPMKNTTCSYDDELKSICFSFMYPHQLWRMITVNLLHTHPIHLFMNLLAQCLQGIPLECKYGTVRIVVIYWLSNVGASLSFMLKNQSASGIGASGALYGLMLFLIVDRFNAMQTNPNRRPFILIQLVLLVLLPCLTIIPIILIIDFNAAHSAHFGGGLVGFLCGVSMLGCPWANDQCIFRTACRRMALVSLALYFIISVTIFFVIDVPMASLGWYKSETNVAWTPTVSKVTLAPWIWIRDKNFSYDGRRLNATLLKYRS